MTTKVSTLTGIFALTFIACLALCPAAAIAQDIYSSISTAHFEVKYQKGVAESDVRKVATLLQDDYRFLSERIGMEMPKKLEVRIYDSRGKFQYEAGTRADWRSVIFAKNILHISPVQGVLGKKPFLRALTFEFTLAYLDPLGDKGCPLWLREALAVEHSGEGDVLTPPMGARMMSFADLNQDIQEYPDPPQRDDVHYVLDRTMKFFRDKYGERKSYALFKEFQTTFSVERVFKKVLGEEFPAVEKAWAAYIAAHSAPMKY